MRKTLNISAITDAMQNLGLSQARIAEETNVSRAAVSKWFKGEDLPRPDKLLKIGMMLRLGFKELLVEQPEPNEPVVAFRHKGGRKTSDEHLDHAKHMGRLLSNLAPLLPFDNYSRPSTLKHPVNEYSYVQEVARKTRMEIGVPPETPVDFQHFIGKFEALHAVLIPVLWAHKENHGNALHIYLPDSMTTWVYLNLDSNVNDFKFWMAHELGHVYSPEFFGNQAEDFADAFAQALLYPEPCASLAYSALSRTKDPGQRVNLIKKEARQFGISPLTVNLALRAYAAAHRYPSVDVGNAIHAATTNFNKEFPTLSSRLFPTGIPSAKEYIRTATTVFKTPFFDVLKRYVRGGTCSLGFVEIILDTPLMDAKEVLEELR